MDKRYQVFVSSTYVDLVEERQAVFRTLMEMDCIPAGMELFPAADEEQWNFIKRVIDDCDYYILILGGRYGSITAEGLSYTEKEYDYAIEKGVNILAFMHENPLEIPLGRSEIDSKLRERLDSFRNKVQTGRLVRFWSNASQLAGVVALSLSKTIKTYPAVGWVRANQLASEEVLNDLNVLRKRNEELEKLSQGTGPLLDNLASLDEIIEMSGAHSFKSELVPGYSMQQNRTWKVQTTWGELFAAIAPYLLSEPSDGAVKFSLQSYLYQRYLHDNPSTTVYSGESMADQDFQTAKVQLVALGLVTVGLARTTEGGTSLFWYLTPRKALLQLRSVKGKSSPPS